MEVHRGETREVIKRFLHHQISFSACIAALDAALAAFIPIMDPSELGSLWELMLANNATVMEEMERREQLKRPPVKPTPS